MQANLVDLLILGLVVLSGFTGLRQGLVQAFGGLIAAVGAFAFALVFSDDLVLILEKSWGIRTTLAGYLAGHVPLTALSLPAPLSHLVQGDYTTPADFLAQLFLFIGCFLLIVLIGSRLLQLLFTAFDALVSWGILGWLNAGLGMIVVVVKNLLILTILLGLIQPAVRLAADLGFAGAVWATQAMAESWLIPKLLVVFIMLKGMLGFTNTA